MRVKNETAINIFGWIRNYLLFDMWEVIGFDFSFYINSCNIHENVSKVMLLESGFKTVVVYLLLIIDIPQSGGELLLIFIIELLDFLLHSAVLKYCILHRNQPVTHIFCIFFNLSQCVFVSSVEFFWVETSCRIYLVSSVFTFHNFAGCRDVLKNANFAELRGW